MYEDFFELKEMPFQVNPDPRFSYKSLGHKLALGKMMFAADQRVGLAVVMGRPGCGKTTTANELVEKWDLDESKVVAWLPTAEDRSRPNFLKLILEAFGFTADMMKRNYGDNRKILEKFLLEQFTEGKNVILVIDEGQRIHSDNIDTLTDLTNFQTATSKLLTVILFAQDTFPNKLKTKDAFRSRIAISANLDPLSYEDMIGMVGFRLTKAGAALGTRNDLDDEVLPDLRPIITDEAMVEVYNITKGLPRDVCVLMSNLFLLSSIVNEKPIPPSHVASTLAEMKKLKKWPVPEEKASE